MPKTDGASTKPAQLRPASNTVPKIWKEEASGVPAFTNSWLNVNSKEKSEYTNEIESCLNKPETNSSKSQTFIIFLQEGVQRNCNPGRGDCSDKQKESSCSYLALIR